MFNYIPKPPVGYSIPPRLTLEEFLTAETSIYFSPTKFSDGRYNLTPEGLIAVLRHAHYDSNGPICRSDIVITDIAMNDLADYLGFNSVDAYNDCLLIEKNRIFRRAQHLCQCSPIPLPPLVSATSIYPYPILTPSYLSTDPADLPPGKT